MTEKDDALTLGVGTVPDPFGLTEPERDLPGDTKKTDDGSSSGVTESSHAPGANDRLGELD